LADSLGFLRCLLSPFPPPSPSPSPPSLSPSLVFFVGSFLFLFFLPLVFLFFFFRALLGAGSLFLLLLLPRCLLCLCLLAWESQVFFRHRSRSFQRCITADARTKPEPIRASLTLLKFKGSELRLPRELCTIPGTGGGGLTDQTPQKVTRSTVLGGTCSASG
jgi:hypothetical protein